MPYNYSHSILALNALKHCGERAQTRILPHESLFLLGTMGADPYYGDALPPPVGNRARTDLADLFHAADGRALFSAMLAKCGDDALFAYAAGFLCHFLLDNRAHPYISTRFPGKLHTPAEIAIDALMLTRDADPRFLAPPGAVYATNGLAAVDALHAQVCWRLFALRTEGVYARSLKKWLRVNNLLFDPRKKKRALLRPLPSVASYLITPGLPDERDLLNLKHAPWGAGASETASRTESFPELFDAACAEAAALIELAAGSPETEGYAPLLTALEGRTADASERLCR